MNSIELPLKMTNNETITSYYISSDKAQLDPHKITSLLKECFWSKDIPLEYVQRFIQYSLCFGVYESNEHELVGFARVISDYTTYAYICDVIIDLPHREQGLGQQLLQAIMQHDLLQGLKAWSLRTSSEARHLYEKSGFTIAAMPETLLEKVDLEIYSRPDFVNRYRLSG